VVVEDDGPSFEPVYDVPGGDGIIGVNSPFTMTNDLGVVLSQDGTIAEWDLINMPQLKYGGDDIQYIVIDGTLVGYVSDPLDPVFSASFDLDGGPDPQYTFTLHKGPVGEAQVLSDFTVVGGGNADFKTLEFSDTNYVYLTASNNAEDQVLTVNTSNAQGVGEVGIENGPKVDPDETLFMSFFEDAGTNTQKGVGGVTFTATKANNSGNQFEADFYVKYRDGDGNISADYIYLGNVTTDNGSFVYEIDPPSGYTLWEVKLVTPNDNDDYEDPFSLQFSINGDDVLEDQAFDLPYTLIDGDGDTAAGMISVDLDSDPGDSLYADEGDDVIFATDADETIDGLGGNDAIDAGGGNDVVDGGQGEDLIWGGQGNDTIDGGAGADTIYANGGDDTIVYDPADTIDGSDGIDTLSVLAPSALDFSGISNIEKIDMDDDGTDQTITLTAQDVLDMSSGDSLDISGGGSAEDTIELNGDWTQDPSDENTFTSDITDASITVSNVSVDLAGTLVSFDENGNEI
jgi:hypothetical protein